VLVGILIVAIAALAVVAVVAWPLVGASPDAPPPDPGDEARRDVEEQLARSLESIREIEMDHRAGNLSDEDFAALDAAERGRAVELMRRADELRGQDGEVPAPAEAETDNGPERTIQA
jgi:hypothetical protein